MRRRGYGKGSSEGIEKEWKERRDGGDRHTDRYREEERAGGCHGIGCVMHDRDSWGLPVRHRRNVTNGRERGRLSTSR